MQAGAEGKAPRDCRAYMEVLRDEAVIAVNCFVNGFALQPCLLMGGGWLAGARDHVLSICAA